MLLSSVRIRSSYCGRENEKSSWGKRVLGMSEKKRNRELGMHCPITRRDFLNGVAIGAGGLLVADPALAADAYTMWRLIRRTGRWRS